MVRIHEGDSVKVESDEWSGLGVIAGLPDTVIFTKTDGERTITIKVEDFAENEGESEAPSWETCKVNDIVEIY